MEVSGQLRGPVAVAPVKYPLNETLGGLQRRSRRFGKENFRFLEYGRYVICDLRIITVSACFLLLVRGMESKTAQWPTGP